MQRWTSRSSISEPVAAPPLAFKNVWGEVLPPSPAPLLQRAATTTSSSASWPTTTLLESPRHHQVNTFSSSHGQHHHHHHSHHHDALANSLHEKLEEWRGGRRLSDGASATFLLMPHTIMTRRRNHRHSTTFFTCLMDDMQWALRELLFQDNDDDDDDINDDIDDDSEPFLNGERQCYNNNNNKDDDKIFADSPTKDNTNNNNNNDGAVMSAPLLTKPVPLSHRQLSSSSSISNTMPSPHTLEQWAVLLYKSHSANQRGFHSMARIFETTAAATPIQLLSACFRDTVLIIDGETPPQERTEFQDVFVVVATNTTNTNNNNTNTTTTTKNSSPYVLNATTLEQESHLHMVASIFGFQPGQDLKEYCGRHKGLDAFLSAICAARLLRGVLPMAQLAQIAVCLEANIPFRGDNVAGSSSPIPPPPFGEATKPPPTATAIQKHHSIVIPINHTKHNLFQALFNSSNTNINMTMPDGFPPLSSSSSSFAFSSPVMERLYQRLVQVNQEFQLHMSETDLERAIQQGADFANRGLGNLASPDPQVFLQHMWSLLPEHYEPLRRQFLYTLLDLHSAVQEMRHFFGALLPKLYQGYQLFYSFRGIPDAMEMTQFHQQVQLNVAIGYEYLLAQCVSLRIVAALAKITGGAQSPMSFFYGDQPHNQPRPDDEPMMIRLGEDLFITEFGEPPQPPPPSTEQQQDDNDVDKQEVQHEGGEGNDQQDEKDRCHDHHHHSASHHHHHEPSFSSPRRQAPDEKDADTSSTQRSNNNNDGRPPDSIRTVVLRILQEDCWGTQVYNFLDPRNAYLAAYLYKKLNHTQMEQIASHPVDDDDDDDGNNYKNNNDRHALDMILLRDYVPLDVIEVIAEDLGRIAVSRTRRLEALLEKLRQEKTENSNE